MEDLVFPAVAVALFAASALYVHAARTSSMTLQRGGAGRTVTAHDRRQRDSADGRAIYKPTSSVG